MPLVSPISPTRSPQYMSARPQRRKKKGSTLAVIADDASDPISIEGGRDHEHDEQFASSKKTPSAHGGDSGSAFVAGVGGNVHALLNAMKTQGKPPQQPGHSKNTAMSASTPNFMSSTSSSSIPAPTREPDTPSNASASQAFVPGVGGDVKTLLAIAAAKKKEEADAVRMKIQQEEEELRQAELRSAGIGVDINTSTDTDNPSSILASNSALNGVEASESSVDQTLRDIEIAAKEKEAAEKKRVEEEAAEKKRLEEEAAEKKRLEEEAAEKKRLEEEAAEKKRKEKGTEEKKRLEEEAAEKRRKEEAAEKKRLDEEEAEKDMTETRPEPEPSTASVVESEGQGDSADASEGVGVVGETKNQKKRRKQKEKREKEKKRLEEEAVEKKRLEEEAAEKKRLEEEAAEKKRLEEEAAEKKRLEEEAAEKKRLEEEAAEKKRLEKEAAERKRLEEEEAAEKKRLEEEAAEKKRLEKEAAERKRLEEEEAAEKRLEEEAEAEAERLLVIPHQPGSPSIEAAMSSAISDSILTTTTTTAIDGQLVSDGKCVVRSGEDDEDDDEEGEGEGGDGKDKLENEPVRPRFLSLSSTASPTLYTTRQCHDPDCGVQFGMLSSANECGLCHEMFCMEHISFSVPAPVAGERGEGEGVGEGEGEVKQVCGRCYDRYMFGDGAENTNTSTLTIITSNDLTSAFATLRHTLLTPYRERTKAILTTLAALSWPPWLDDTDRSVESVGVRSNSNSSANTKPITSVNVNGGWGGDMGSSGDAQLKSVGPVLPSDVLMHQRQCVVWLEDRSVSQCCSAHCQVQFGLLTRRHHCRLCGKIYCNACSKSRVSLAPSTLNPQAPIAMRARVRVCDGCVAVLHEEEQRLVVASRLKSNLMIPHTHFRLYNRMVSAREKVKDVVIDFSRLVKLQAASVGVGVGVGAVNGRNAQLRPLSDDARTTLQESIAVAQHRRIQIQQRCKVYENVLRECSMYGDSLSEISAVDSVGISTSTSSPIGDTTSEMSLSLVKRPEVIVQEHMREAGVSSLHKLLMVYREAMGLLGSLQMLAKSK